MIIYRGNLSIELEENIKELKEQIKQLKSVKQLIVTSATYHLLDGKTQMLDEKIEREIRSRLDHTINVAAISKRTISKIYNLCSIEKISNTELFKLNKQKAELETEIIALSHDLGHTPFGHTGEAVVNEFMQSITDEDTINSIINKRIQIFGKDYEEEQGHLNGFCGRLSFEHNEQSAIEFYNIIERHGNEFNKIDKKKIIQGILAHSISRVPEIPNDLSAQIVRQADKIEYRNKDAEELMSYLKEDRLEKELFEYNNLSSDSRINQIVEDLANEAIEKGKIPDENYSLEKSKRLRKKYENIVYFLGDDGKRGLLTGENRERQQMIYKKLLEYYYEHPEKIPTKSMAFNSPINNTKQAKRVMSFDRTHMKDTTAELAISYVNTFTNAKCMAQYIRLVKQRVLKGKEHGIEPITKQEIEERKKIQIEDQIAKMRAIDMYKGREMHTYQEYMSILTGRNKKFAQNELTQEAKEAIQINRSKHEKENEEDELLWFSVNNADDQRRQQKFIKDLIESTPKRIEMKDDEARE